MAQCCHGAVSIAVTAMVAGMGGVAVFGAGGLGHNIGVIMAQCCHGAVHIALAAAVAGMGGVAVFGAGGLGHDIGVIMAQRFYGIVHIALAAALAGIGGVAVLGAGGSSDDCIIVMAQGLGGFGVGIAAGSADVSGHAAAGTGCFTDRRLIGMTVCRDGLGIAVAAASAGVGLGAVLGAGSCHHGHLIIMVQRRHGVAHIAVAANRAGIGGVAVLGAGGRRHSGSVAMAGGGNGLGVAVAALGAGIGDGAVLGAGRCSLGGLLIAVLVACLNSHHILGAVYHIGRGASCHAGEGKLGICFRTGLNGAGGCRTGKGAAIIAAPCNLGQLPPVVPGRGNHHLDVAEALHSCGYFIGGSHRSASAAGIGANGGPGSAVGGNLNVCPGAVVAMGRRRNLNGVKPHLSPQIYPGIHAGGLTAGGPIIGIGAAVNEVRGHAVVSPIRIAGSGSRCRSGIGNLRTGSLNGIEVGLGNGRIACIGNGLLALQRIHIGGLAHLQGYILSGQQLRIGVAAASAGVNSVTGIVLGCIVVAQRRNRLGVAVAAVGAGIRNAAGLGAGGCLGGGHFIVVYLRRRIGVQGAVCVKAAGYHGLIQVIGIAAIHGKAHCPHGKADFLGLLGLSFRAGVIAPQAEHSADDGGAAQRCAANLVVAPVGGIGIAAVKIIVLTQHIIEIAGGVDDLEAVTGQVGCGTEGIAAPAAGPVAHHNVLIKGVGLGTNGCTGSVAVFNAVVEGNGGHARLFHHGRELVDILDKVAVLIAALEVAKAHAAAGIAVIGIFVGAKVEVLAAFAGEVVDILLDKGLGERHCRSVGHVNGADGAVIAASNPSQGSRRRQNRVHMSGAVEQGDDLNSGCIGSGKDLVHFAFAPLSGGSTGVAGVARLNSGFYRATGIGLGIDGHRHIVQKKPHSIVADGQHNVRVAIRLCFVDKGFDPIHCKVLSSAVQHGDLHIVVIGSSEHRCREHADQHADGKQQR